MFVINSKSTARRGKNAALYLGTTLAGAAVSQSLPRHSLSLPGSRRAPADPLIIMATEKALDFPLPPQAVTPIAHTSSKILVKDVNHAIVLKNMIDRWNDEGLPQLELSASRELLDRIGTTLAQKNPHLASSTNPESAKDFLSLAFVSIVANIQKTGNPRLVVLLKKVLAYQAQQSTHAAVTPSVADPAQVIETPTPNLPVEGQDVESVEKVVESETVGEEREDALLIGKSEDPAVYEIDHSATETPVHDDDAEVDSNELVVEQPSDVEDRCPEEELEPEIVLTLEGETTCQEVDDAAAEDDGSELFTINIASAADSTSQPLISPPLSPVDLVSLPISQPAEPAPCTPETPIALPSLTVIELPTSSNGSEAISQLLDVSAQTTEVVIENQVTTMEGDTEDTEAQKEEAIDAADVDPTTSGNTESMESESDSDKANVDVQVDSVVEEIEHNDGQDKARQTKNHKWFVVQNGKAVKAAHTSRPSAPHQPVPLPAIWEPASFNRFAVFEKPPVPAPASKKARKASKSLQAATTVIHNVEEKNEDSKASNPPVDDCSPSETSSSALVDVSVTEVVIAKEVTMEGDAEETEAADVDPTTSGNTESMEIESDSDIANVDVQVDSVTEGIEDNDDRDKVRRTKNDKWFVVQKGKTIKAAHASRPSASHQSVPLPAIWEPNSFNRFAAFEKPPAPAPASKKAKKASKSLQAPTMVTRKVEEDIKDPKASDAPIDNCSPSETSSSELVNVSMPASISAAVEDEELPPVTADENEGWSTVKKRKVLKATKTTSQVPETSTSEVEARIAKPMMKAKAWLEMLKPQAQPALKWDFSESPWESQVSKTATSAFSYARAAVIAPGPLASAITSSTPSDTTISASSPWKDVEPAPSSTSGEAAVVELATEDDWLSPEDKAKEHEAAAVSSPSPRTTTSPTSQPANASSFTTERNDIEPALSSLKTSGESALASSGMPQNALGKADTMRKERRDRAAEVARFDSVMERLKSQLGGKPENMTPEIDIGGSKTMCSLVAGPSNHITPSPSLNHDTT